MGRPKLTLGSGECTRSTAWQAGPVKNPILTLPFFQAHPASGRPGNPVCFPAPCTQQLMLRSKISATSRARGPAGGGAPAARRLWQRSPPEIYFLRSVLTLRTPRRFNRKTIHFYPSLVKCFVKYAHPIDRSIAGDGSGRSFCLHFVGLRGQKCLLRGCRFFDSSFLP